MADQVLGALANEPEGLSSEALQRVMALAAAELRVVLAELVTEGQLVRSGQARGTRYQLPVIRKRRPAPPAPGERPFPMQEGVTALPPLADAPAPVVPEPAPVEVLDELRSHLAPSLTLLSLRELEKTSETSSGA